MKLYLKRLVQTFLFLAALIVLTALLFTLFITIFFWLKPLLKAIIVYFCLLLSAILLTYTVLLKRYESTLQKATYLEKLIAEDYTFIKDYRATLKSKENVVHTLAFISIALTNSIRIAITAHKPFVGLLFQAVILISVFAALNTLVWCLVHRKWLKSRYNTKYST